MKTLCCTLLMAVLLFAFEEALAEEDPCQFRHFEVESCIEDGNVDFNRMADPAYGQQICNDIQPAVESCIKRHRAECPRIKTFQRRTAQGRAVRKLLRDHQRFCESDQISGSRGSNRCRDENVNPAAFQLTLNTCFEPVNVPMRHRDMCGPEQQVVDCMKLETRRNKGCLWMTNSLRGQLNLSTSYYAAVRAIKYNCDD